MDQAKNLRELVRNAPVRAPVASAPRPPLSACRSIAVTSGKGGVGKTNTALALGMALAALKKKVLILDADLGLANIHLLIGIAPRYNLGHLIEGRCGINEVVCRVNDGMDVLPGASGFEALANLEQVRMEALKRQLQEVESSYDYLLIDTGAGIGRITTGFARSADSVIMVMTPEPTSLADAYAMTKVLYEKQAASVSVLVNMASSDREGRETFDKLNALVIQFLKRPLELLEIVPFDAEVPRLVKRQKAVMGEAPRRPFSLRMQSAARRLCGMRPANGSDGFFARLFRPVRGPGRGA